MRLKSIYLASFKNLRNFTVTFSPESATTVLVGRNASGKSNLIEAIVTIFRDLDAGPSQIRLTPFQYKIGYTVHGNDVEIEHDPSLSRNRTKISVNGSPLMVSKLTSDVRDRILPDTVFAYYSGPSNRLEAVFEAPLAAFRDAMIKRERNARQRMLYGRPIHSKFVLLSFLAEADVSQFEFLSRELGIEGVESVLFVLKQPYWASGRRGAEAKHEFWGAAGVVQSFLDEVYAAALAPLLLEQRVPVGIRQHKTLEYVYLYLPDQETLVRLVDSLASKQAISRSRELFTILESAFVSDLIADIKVNLRKKNVDGTVTFTELSEGEQQLLLVLGLLRFTKEEESLFLLDEPDTHLNPAWSLRFLELVDEAVGYRDLSQLIVASHDPVAISLLRKEQVRYLDVDDEVGNVTASEPKDDPIDLGVSGVLLSELFGFQSAFAPERADQIAERERLRLRDENLTPEELARLAELDDMLGELDFTSVHPDRLYILFMREMIAQERDELARKPTLSREEALEQRRLTEEIVRNIRTEEDVN
jgi:predicted ATPase